MPQVVGSIARGSGRILSKMSGWGETFRDSELRTAARLYGLKTGQQSPSLNSAAAVPPMPRRYVLWRPPPRADRSSPHSILDRPQRSRSAGRATHRSDRPRRFPPSSSKLRSRQPGDPQTIDQRGVIVGIRSGPAHRADLVGEPANPRADRRFQRCRRLERNGRDNEEGVSANSPSDEPSAAIRSGSSVGRAASRSNAAWRMSSGVKRSV